MTPRQRQANINLKQKYQKENLKNEVMFEKTKRNIETNRAKAE